MKIKPDELVFESGLVTYACNGIVGISADPGRKNWIYYGRDGEIPTVLRGPRYPVEMGALSPLECAELADHMIARWQEFRAAALKRRARAKR